MAKDEYGLTPSQRDFADAYILNAGNATQAYLKAYKNVKSVETASANSSRLLRNAKVRDYIDMRTREPLKRAKLGAEQVVLTLYGIATKQQQKSYKRVVDHLNDDEVIIDQTAEYTPSDKNVYEAAKIIGEWLGFNNPNNDLVRDKLRADIEKAQAEARITQNKADKLTSDEGVDELLQALINPQTIDSEEAEDDSII